jgi:hypothetical protein
LGKRTIRDILFGNAVSINGVFIPSTQIEDHLERYCTSLGVVTGDERCPFYIPGSATLMKYKGRYFMICTRHQLDQTKSLDAVCLLLPHSDGQTKCVTSGRARWYEALNDGDHHQIVVFDFTETCSNTPELRSMFFDFRQQHPDIPEDQMAAILTYGYLTSGANFDYENNKIEQVRARVTSRFVSPGSDDALHIIEPVPALDFDPDGMSGGPTFCVVRESPDRFGVHLAGVTVRGSRDKLMVIKAGAIQAVLDTIFRDRPSG